MSSGQGDNPFRRPSRTWRRPVFALVTLVSLIALAPTIWKAWRYWYWRHSAQVRVDAEIARLKTASEPLTAPELHAVHRLPDGVVNLTKDWLRVLSQLDSKRPHPHSHEYQSLPVIGMRKLEDLESGADQGCLSETEAYLRRVAPQIEELLTISRQRGEACFPVDFENHIAAKLLHAQQLRFAANTLSLLARISAIRADAPTLENSLVALMALPHTLDHSRTLVEHLVRCALHRLACEAVLYAANHGRLSQEQLRRFAKELEEIDFHRAAGHAYAGERVITWHALDVNAALLASDGTQFWAWIRKAGPIDRAFILEAFPRAIQASQSSYEQSSYEFDVLDQELKQAMSLSGIERTHYLYSVLLLPSTYAAHVAFFNQDARRRVTQATLLAHDFRLRTNRWPQSMEELIDDGGPSPLIDPFNGEALKLLPEDSNLVIYSVGKNLADDGGKEANGRFQPDIIAVAKCAP